MSNFRHIVGQHDSFTHLLPRELSVRSSATGSHRCRRRRRHVSFFSFSFFLCAGSVFYHVRYFQCVHWSIRDGSCNFEGGPEQHETGEGVGVIYRPWRASIKKTDLAKYRVATRLRECAQLTTRLISATLASLKKKGKHVQD